MSNVFRAIEHFWTSHTNNNPMSYQIPNGTLSEQDYAALQRQLDLMQEREQSLRITLLSMGDGVITTDNQARITFLNPSAQELTGWTLERAVGRPFAEVFDIYDSITGKPSDNIVLTVLKTGTKVNLGNHTVLKNFDGTERHISDSAAPIRNALDELIGVVLIFSDVTERYLLQQQLAMSEARSSSAVKIAKLGTWDYDGRTHTVKLSPQYKAICGMDPDFDPEPEFWRKLVIPEDYEKTLESRNQAFRSDSYYSNQFRIYRENDGQLRYVRNYASIERAADGNVLRINGVLQDTTEELTVSERIRESEALYRSAFENAVVGMCHVGLDGQFMRVNRALCDIIGYSAEELLRFNFLQLVHPEDADLLHDSLAAISTSRKITSGTERRFIRSDGEVIWLSLFSSVMTTSMGRPLYIITSVQDTTEKRKYQEILETSEHRLRRAQSISHTGNWEYDVVNQKMWASEEALRLHGFISRDGRVDTFAPNDVVIPEQREIQLAAIKRLIYQNEPYDIEYVIEPLDGSPRRTVRSVAVAERDAFGNAVMLFGVIQDISEKRRLEEEFGKVLATTKDGFWLSDKDFKIVMVNDAICSMTGYSREELLGVSIANISVNDDMNIVHERRALIKNTGSEYFDARLLRKDGSVFDAEVSLSYLPSSDSSCSFIRDISERKRRENHIAYLSYHDSLTGLYNRAHFEAECERMTAERVLPVTVVMGDINGLKLTNDVFGHTQGDKLLCAIAQILQDCARSQDIVARIGGDEFCILMPYAEADDAKRLCDDIYAQCERELIRFDEGGEMHPSLSIGYATRQTTQRSFNDVFKEAEDAMYKRKLLESKSMHSSLIASIRSSMHEKSRETREHADRLADMACKIGGALELGDSQIAELELLSSLHDLGKIGIPERILDKPGPLTPEEWMEMQKHPEIGYRIAQTSPELINVAKGILSHHERWDGKGYPQGLKGEDIPLLARILSVVDSFDAMTSNRVYHEAIPVEYALKEIKACSGSQFDPDIAALFLEMMHSGKMEAAISSQASGNEAGALL